MTKDPTKPGAAAHEMDSKLQPAFPPTVTGNEVGNTRWSSGLCDCCSDISSCCLTWWCPCITFGRIAEIADKGTTSCAASGALYAVLLWLAGCSCLYSCLYRTKLRKQYMLEESPCNDCLVHCCCESCALCQEYRELKHRGFDMASGWQENLQRSGSTVALSPSVVEKGMTR